MQDKNRNYDQILQRLHQKTGAFAEIFEETRLENEQTLKQQKVSPLLTRKETGVGFRLIRHGRQTYGYTNDLSVSGLTSLEEEVLAMFFLMDHSEEGTALASARPAGGVVSGPLPSPIPYLLSPKDVNEQERVRILRAAEGDLSEALRLSSAGVSEASLRLQFFLRNGTRAENVSLKLSDETRRVRVLNSEGVDRVDERVYTRLRAYYTLVNEPMRLSSSEWTEFVKSEGYEAFQGKDYLDRLRERILTSAVMLTAEKGPSGVMPVVFGEGTGGTLFHECCGHQLEASAIVNHASDFEGRIGEIVASSKVTLVDDATVEGAYGSGAMDDEGHMAQRNILIDKGILRSYMVDRLSADRLGMVANGSGRRQNYTFTPTSRMSNTYVENGTDDPRAMMAEIPEGLYVTNLGGGSGGSVFSILMNGGFRIINGQIDRPVKACMLSDRGMEMMHKIDRVGNDLTIEGGSFCGASSGLVPVTSSAPTLRVKEMKVNSHD